MPAFRRPRALRIRSLTPSHRGEPPDPNRGGPDDHSSLSFAFAARASSHAEKRFASAATSRFEPGRA